MRAVPLLNIDAGELPGEPPELYALAHLANVACGGHAGDPTSMRSAVEMCMMHATALGAHPSFPDRAGFGRRHLALDSAELERTVSEQCEALARVAGPTGLAVTHCKLHGALYHAAARDEATARACVRGIVRAPGELVTVVGPADSALSAACAGAGLAYAIEAFADRGTHADGSLIARGETGALITDPGAAAAKARALLGSCDTLCVHGDEPSAVAVARAVREVLDAASA